MTKVKKITLSKSFIWFPDIRSTLFCVTSGESSLSDIIRTLGMTNTFIVSVPNSAKPKIFNI